jgi:hypothetical protein
MVGGIVEATSKDILVSFSIQGKDFVFYFCRKSLSIGIWYEYIKGYKGKEKFKGFTKF